MIESSDLQYANGISSANLHATHSALLHIPIGPFVRK
jgi:hypothetical protein